MMVGTSGAASSRLAAGIILAAAVALIGGAFFFQYGLGLEPCELCLKQRLPYYAAMPVAALLAVLPGSPSGRRVLAAAGFVVLIGLFLTGACLGVYHAGVEWHLWQGPTGCTGTLGPAAGMQDFLKSLETARVVRCDEPAFRFLGLSLAGWNVIASIGLAAVAVLGLRSVLKERKSH